jgi:hypothetical protein
MVGRNSHSFQEVKTVRIEALHAGIELEILAAVEAGFFHQPVQ